MRRAVLLATLSACWTSPPPTEPPPPPPPKRARTAVPPGLSVQWLMRVEGDRLRIDYTVFNNADAPVEVVDALMISDRVDEDRVLVHKAATADTIAFTRAMAPSSGGVRPYRPRLPHYREIAAHAQLHGAAHVPLPIAAWHNYAGAYAIDGPRPNAVLEIGYRYPLPDGAAEREPIRVIRGDVQPLPRGAALAPIADQVRDGRGVVMMPCATPCPDGY